MKETLEVEGKQFLEQMIAFTLEIIFHLNFQDGAIVFLTSVVAIPIF